MDRLTPAILLDAYSMGLFPMGDEDSGEIHWYSPDPRAILPIDGLRVSRSLRRIISRDVFEVTFDQAFEATVLACADRSSTWISGEIVRSYTELHKLGHGHSVECWQEGELVGGLYGVHIGSAFFGESMFHRVSNASKVALYHLVEYLKDHMFTMLDIQFMTSHLESIGAVDVPRSRYLRILHDAVSQESKW